MIPEKEEIAKPRVSTKVSFPLYHLYSSTLSPISGSYPCWYEGQPTYGCVTAEEEEEEEEGDGRAK